MFKENASHIQLNIFAVSNGLSKKQSKLWNASREHKFYSQIFCKIDESKFKVLYSSNYSRPNVPINQMVGALILKHLKNWTYNELFQNLNFNLLTRHALGINSLDEDVFSEASIFNFQNRLIDHLKENNEDLLESVFHQLTKDQLLEFNVNTSVQRGDSFLVGSNIVDYNRLRLLIEIIRRLSRILIDEDKDALNSLISPYTKNTSSNYVYHVEKVDLDSEYNKLAKVYHKILNALGGRYSDKLEFKNFNRVAHEHFTISADQYIVKPYKELNSRILMSPDDIEATYRDKRSQKSKGYVTHISETVNPENTVNLITDVVTKPNNIGDAEILEERLPKMLERTEDLKEYFVDGQYGGPGVDKVAKDQVKIYQKTVRSRKDGSKVTIEEDQNGNYWVRCEGGQRIKSSITRLKKDGVYNRKATFKNTICEECPIKDRCKLKIRRGVNAPRDRTYYFSRTQIDAHKRHQNISLLKGSKRYSRANVEATVKEAKRGMKNGKVRIRGRIRISFHMILTSIAINFTRISGKMNEILQKWSELALYAQVKHQVVKIEIRKWFFSENEYEKLSL